MRLAIGSSITSDSAQRTSYARVPATDQVGIAILLEARALALRGRAVRLLEDALDRDVGAVGEALALCADVPMIAPRIQRLITLASRLDDRAQLFRAMAKAAIKAVNLNRWE